MQSLNFVVEGGNIPDRQCTWCDLQNYFHCQYLLLILRRNNFACTVGRLMACQKEYKKSN
jgi:hypothetical protein